MDTWEVKYNQEVAEAKARRETEYGVGNVWTTDELQKTFDVQGFSSPFVIVVRNSDGKKGSIQFDHQPRVYYRFVPYSS